MATEISFIEVTHEPSIEELEFFFDDIIPLPRGFRTAILRKSDSDPRKIIGFSTWVSVESHIKFANSTRFPLVISSISRLGSWPPCSFHVYFDQGLPHPVFHCPLAELIMMRLQPNISRVGLKRSLDTYMHAASETGLRCHYYGPKYEDPTFFVVLLGWNSKEGRESTTLSPSLNLLWEEINRLTIHDVETVRHVIPLGEWGALREMELQVKRQFNLLK